MAKKSRLQKASQQILIKEAMDLTGWDRERVLSAMSYLENNKAIVFPKQGGILINQNKEVI